MSIRCPSKNQNGFTLIEVLISVLVFIVGILGLGGLQIASLKSANNAHYTTTASILAMDLADRMKSNPNAVRSGLYGSTVSCGSTSRLCRSSACSVEELAKFDLQEIMCGSRVGSRREGGVIGLLPDGKMSVSCGSGGCTSTLNETKATHEILISWNSQKTDHKQKYNDQTRSLTLSVIP